MNKEQDVFSADQLKLDAGKEADRIGAFIREGVFKQLRRKGVVVGLSGGIDSSAVAALSVHALGADRVIGIFMPESDSSDESLRLGQLLAKKLGIRTFKEDISGILQGADCYRRRDEAIRAVVPAYHAGYKSKLVLSSLESTEFRISYVVVEDPSGKQTKVRLTADAFLALVAATNFKQRTRKMMEYYYADRFLYAVAGTPNRLEYDQGFFVKNGDGSADIKPIAHLYKSQVYEMARFLGVPDEILGRLPTTDTYSLAQSQEEFYFSLPYDKMDLCLYAKDRQIPAGAVAGAIGLTETQVERVYRDIDAKRSVARYLHMEPLLIEAIGKSSPCS
ncbi:NAD(+) synthase [Nitrospira sp. NS4]|uniref:NAD(+) synthase n=1 Tax=Nitrospira sp. NS4 TaxID=3414498 RepID=UPI003C2FA408